jgi:hypothetical protein
MAKKKVYTSGTMYEEETGRYMDAGLAGEMALQNRATARKKKVGTGSATVKKGNKVPAARRGVGQETIDGFVNSAPKSLVKTAMKNKNKPPRRR